MEVLSKVKVFDGTLFRCKHTSGVLGNLEAKFSVYVPTDVAGKIPQIYWLSGLTCTDENFVTKAGAFGYAQNNGVALVIPDTSPRGANIPGEDDSWDFGTGAGFYVDATAAPWSANYKMYSYITAELPALVNSSFPELDESRVSVMGHSMGGHGALTIALKNAGKYKSVSAFAPITNPINCPWGEKAFTNYLGAEDKAAWAKYDTVELLKTYNGPQLPLLVHQGTADSFLENQLKPQALVEALKGQDKVVGEVKMAEGYDHSYYFIATFIEEHIAFHKKHL